MDRVDQQNQTFIFYSLLELRKETKVPEPQDYIRPDSYRHFTARFKASVLPKVRIALVLGSWAGKKHTSSFLLSCVCVKYKKDFIFI